MTIQALEFDTASDAIQHMNADATGFAIAVGGKYLVARQSEIDRLDAAGVSFAYLCDHEMPDGTHRIVTIPVN